MTSRRKFLSISSILTLSYLPFLNLTFFENEYSKAKKLFSSYCPQDFYKFIGIGRWQGVSPKQGFKAKIRLVETWDLPHRMKYLEFVEYSKKFIDWELSTKLTSNSLEAGEIVRLDFYFSGNQAKWHLDFPDEKTLYNFLKNFEHDPALKVSSFPGKMEVVSI